MTTRKAGKAIGGGKLTYVMRDGECIGTINHTLDLWIVTIKGHPFEVYHSFHQALTAAARLMKVANGKPAAHTGRDGKPCSGEATAKAAPRAAFVPRCSCNNAGTCRACKVAAALADAFQALRREPAAFAVPCARDLTTEQRERVADGIVGAFYALRTVGASRAPLTVVAKPTAAPEPADRALRHAAHVYHTAGAARHGEALDQLRAAAVKYADESRPVAPVVALTIVARKSEVAPLRPLTPDVPVFDPILVARGIVETFQAIRDAAHMALLTDIEERVQAMATARKAPRLPASRVQKCDKCRKSTDTYFAFKGSIWCPECRAKVAKITARAERAAFAV